MSFKEFFQSSAYGKLVYALGAALLALVIFAAGTVVGYNRAAFSYDWDASHYSNMSSLERLFAPLLRQSEDLNPHGTIGNILSVDLPSFVVHGADQAEQIVTVGSSTVIRFLRSPAKPSDIKAGEQVIVVGVPDSRGRIQATFLRIMPMSTATSTTPGGAEPHMPAP